MKEQTRISFRSRKSAKSTLNETHGKQVKVIDEGIIKNAFRQATTIPVEPTKVIQKAEVRKSNRIASNLKQTKLPVKKLSKATSNEVNTPKRKSSISSDKPTTKKLKSLETPTLNTTIEEKATVDVVEKSVCEGEGEENTVVDEETIVESKDDSNSFTEESTLIEVTEESSIVDESKPQATDISNTQEKQVKELKIAIGSQQEDTKDIKTDKVNDINDSQLTVDSPAYISHDDSPSPPSFLTEPSTPPVQLESPLAPYKTYLSEADKLRIEHEKSTLTKLRKALDIVITDRMARNRPTLYHQIEPVLRNSTRRAITISHLCKAMYLAPSLYQLDVKELRDFGGKVTEAFLVQFGSTWKCPLVGKDLQSRADLLADALEEFFLKNKEPNATIPEFELPRLDLVVDKKEWMKEAKLPPGVKALLEAHKKVDEAEKEKEKPKAKPVGTVKDRMAALRARLAAKKAT